MFSPLTSSEVESSSVKSVSDPCDYQLLYLLHYNQLPQHSNFILLSLLIVTSSYPVITTLSLIYTFLCFIAGFQNTWNGYVIATDNLDRNVRPRRQTVQAQTVSMHWSNAIAVKDRCDFSDLADEMPTPNLNSCDVTLLLPTEDDCQKLIENISVIVGRLLVKFVPGFSKFSALTQPHIYHRHSSEMSAQSHVVSIQFLF